MSICDSKSETSVVDQKAVAHPLWVMFVHLSIRLYLSVHLGHIGQFRHRSKEGGCQRILRSWWILVQLYLSRLFAGELGFGYLQWNAVCHARITSTQLLSRKNMVIYTTKLTPTQNMHLLLLLKFLWKRYALCVGDYDTEKDTDRLGYMVAGGQDLWVLRGLRFASSWCVQTNSPSHPTGRNTCWLHSLDIDKRPSWRGAKFCWLLGRDPLPFSPPPPHDVLVSRPRHWYSGLVHDAWLGVQTAPSTSPLYIHQHGFPRSRHW